MANGIKISALPEATEVVSTDILAGVQNGTTKKFRFSTILNWIKGVLLPSDIGAEPTLTFDATPTSGSDNPVTSDGIYWAVRVRNPQVTLFNTLTDVHTDTTITMADDFTNYKFLGVVFNSRSPAASARRIILLLSTNLIPQGGFYYIANDEVSGYIRINYVSGQNKQIRFQATNISTLYLTNILGIY